MRSSLCVVLPCLIGVVFGQYTPVCDPANYTGPPSIPLPNLPTQFSVVIEVNLGQENRTWNVQEYFDEDGNRGRFEITRNGSEEKSVGIYDYDDGEIFMISGGDACEVKLIADNSTRRFLTNTPIFGFQDGVNGSVHIGTVRDSFLLLRRNTNATWRTVEVVRGIPCNVWQTCTVMENNSYTLDYYFATENWEFALGDGPTPVQVILTAINARGGEAESLKHTYSFVSFDTGPRSVPDEVFTVPIGLVCTGRIPGRPVPPFPKHFSATLEAVQRNRKTAVVYKEFYDSPSALSRVDVYFDGGTRAQDSPGPLSLIRDDARNIDYIINRQLNNCTVLPRDQDKKFFYSFAADSYLVAQLATPPQLITLAQMFPYVYEGVTNVRGVDVDAWIGTLPFVPFQFTNPGLVGLLRIINPTFQVFFTRPGWRITSVRTVSTEPVLWRITVSAFFEYTNATDNVTTSGYSSGFFDIFDFSSEEPDFDVFDVSTCFSPSEYNVLSLSQADWCNYMKESLNR